MTCRTSAYETLAAEYYDPALHPTCANFRHASKTILQSWLNGIPRTGDACELGCGMSLLAELLSERKMPLKQLYLTDSAPTMLAYSAQWVEHGAHLLLADARELSFENDALDLCVASLGDPYNEDAYWQEMSRVVAPGGYVMFTTPSYAWALRFRGSESPDDFTRAEFILQTGRRVFTPSMVLPDNEQVDLIESAKHLKVSEIKSFRFSQLSAARISRKLDVARGGDTPVVTGYLVQKLG